MLYVGTFKSSVSVFTEAELLNYKKEKENDFLNMEAILLPRTKNMDISGLSLISASEAKAAGIDDYSYISTSEIPFSPEIRKICEGNTCRSYSSCWACPPSLGSYEKTKEICLSYDNLLVFNSFYPIEDSFDFDGMKAAMLKFKDVCDNLHNTILNRSNRFLVLSNEGCFRCKSCTYPNEPCRFPEKLHPSIEGFGILVNRLASAAGLNYLNGTNTVTYFGGVLFDKINSVL